MIGRRQFFGALVGCLAGAFLPRAAAKGQHVFVGLPGVPCNNQGEEP